VGDVDRAGTEQTPTPVGNDMTTVLAPEHPAAITLDVPTGLVSPGEVLRRIEESGVSEDEIRNMAQSIIASDKNVGANTKAVNDTFTIYNANAPRLAARTGNDLNAMNTSDVNPRLLLAWTTSVGASMWAVPEDRRCRHVRAARGFVRSVVLSGPQVWCCVGCLEEDPSILRKAEERGTHPGCDICGTVVETFYPTNFPIGASIWAGDVCDDCHDFSLMLFTKKVKTGRNDPCPCGSGTKFKKCCR
jgi:hypothetical protein